MRDLVDMVDEEQKEQAAERASNYTYDHGVLLGLQLKEWTDGVKSRLREERKQVRMVMEFIPMLHSLSEVYHVRPDLTGG